MWTIVHTLVNTEVWIERVEPMCWAESYCPILFRIKGSTENHKQAEGFLLLALFYDPLCPLKALFNSFVISVDKKKGHIWQRNHHLSNLDLQLFLTAICKLLAISLNYILSILLTDIIFFHWSMVTLFTGNDNTPHLILKFQSFFCIFKLLDGCFNNKLFL